MTVIREAYDKAVSEGTDVRAIVVINPGNPTGASLSEWDVEDVVKFAAEKKLVIFADEVYQTNVFIGKFHSFKRALRILQQKEPGKYDHVELASLNSVSKGMVGECGHRAGYFELVGWDQEVQAQIYKLVSIMLCPPVIGQCLLEMVVNPPKKGDPSHHQYHEEYNVIKNGLQQRATALYDAFERMEGVEVGEPQGSMYLFPTLRLPDKAIQAAKEAGKNPDDFYCLRLLDATGICVVPGSGFGQKPGTLHLRTTFLAPGTDWVDRWTKFHHEFMEKYR
jgi:alanine transaminase